MKKGIVDPLSLLREYVSGKKPIKLSGESLVFGNVKLPLKTETAWNPKRTDMRYCLGDLWLYLDCHIIQENSASSRYLLEVGNHGLSKINTFDEDEIQKYFTGKIDDSEAINQELKATLKIGANDKKKQDKKDGQDPLVKKKTKIDEETKGEGDSKDEATLNKSESISQEKENIKLMEILSKIEKVIDSKNRMLRKQNKSFKSVLTYLAAPETKEPEKPTVAPTQTSTQQQQYASTTNTSSAPSQPTPNKKASTKLEEVLLSGGQLNASNPIILVFPQYQAGSLCLDNAKEFLMDGKYIDPKTKESTVKNKVTIQREIQGKKILFDIMSDVNVLKKENLWPRVVAVFLNGHTYQLQSWPDGDKVATFLSKKRGYFMKYNDMPVPENVKIWNVKMLEINRNKRFMDATTKNYFWDDLEAFLLKPAR